MSFKIPHTYVIIFSLILICAALTWVIPSGEFQRKAVDVGGTQRELIVSGSYTRVDQQPQTWQVFSAFYKGFVRSPKIIVFILILGGAFWILNESRAIDAGVVSFLRRSQALEKFRLIRKIGLHNIIITSIMLLFSFFGAVFGMSEETIAFVIIFVPLAISMGYDSITGVCMCFIGAGIGFAGCLLNPFTLGIAQEIAGITLFSGIEYRFVIWVIVNIAGIGYVLWYAARIRKNPERSPVFHEDDYWRKHQDVHGDVPTAKPGRPAWIVYLLIIVTTLIYSVFFPVSAVRFGNSFLRMPALPVFTVLFIFTGWITLKKSVQLFILTILMYTILVLMLGVMAFDWSLLEIAALFFAMALAAGFALGKTSNDLARLFIAGARDILSAALVVGLAGGIVTVLEDGKIIDTILYGISNSMGNSGKVTTLSLMYVFQSGLNMVITSGTAKAALIMPILRDISEMVNLSKQATVTAFHIGDGFTNLITPTSGVLIGVLEVARIPFSKWFRWAWKLVLFLVILGWLLLIPTVTMNLSGY